MERGRDGGTCAHLLTSSAEIEDAFSIASELLECCRDDRQIDPEAIQSLLEICRANQAALLTLDLQEISDDEALLPLLMVLSDTLVNAIKTAENRIDGDKKPPAAAKAPGTPRRSQPAFPTESRQQHERSDGDKKPAAVKTPVSSRRSPSAVSTAPRTPRHQGSSQIPTVPSPQRNNGDKKPASVETPVSSRRSPLAVSTAPRTPRYQGSSQIPTVPSLQRNDGDEKPAAVITPVTPKRSPPAASVTPENRGQDERLPPRKMSSQIPFPSPQQRPSQSDIRITPEICGMVQRKDIFPLICMLRTRGNTCLDSALALMRFAREAEKNPHNNDAKVVREEIISNGGMSALLDEFHSEAAKQELKVATALAVAYLLPACIKSNDPPCSAVGLQIVDCLRFLFTPRPTMIRGEMIDVRDLCHASVTGVYTFWRNALSPALSRALSRREALMSGSITPLERPSLMTRRNLDLHEEASGGALVAGRNQQRDVLELEELLRQTIALIVQMAKRTELITDDSDVVFKSAQQLLYKLVKQVCAIDMARPIAAREGLLDVLASWIRSQDEETMCAGVVSVKGLAAARDGYMAGWIHSLIVDKGVLSKIVPLSQTTTSITVQVAVAETLLSLCRAPHTRTAVVESGGISCLVSFLRGFAGASSNQRAAFAAGKALLPILIESMAQSSMLTLVSQESNTVMSSITSGGAIEEFVTIALRAPRGDLRELAVEALRVLSEDPSERLSKYGVAKALGRVIKNDVHGDKADEGLLHVLGTENFTVNLDSLIKELQQSLCAWANILDRHDHERNSSATSKEANENAPVSEDVIEFAGMGGLEGLLHLATIHTSFRVGQNSNVTNLAVESCGCLASLSSLLLSNRFASRGGTSCSLTLLHALGTVLDSAWGNSDVEASTQNELLTHYSLQGIGAMAKYEPHKLEVIDKFLPCILKAKPGRCGPSLGFWDDEFAKQVTGNDPTLMGDLFCMQRSMQLQAMARTEILQTLSVVWEKALNNVFQDNVAPYGSELRDLGGSSSTLESLIESLALEEEGVEERNTILDQYYDVYEKQLVNGRDPSLSELVHGWTSEHPQVTKSLLSRHVFPLNSTVEEKDWILLHRRVMQDDTPAQAVPMSSSLVSDHVQHLLDSCIPSRLIQSELLPIFDLRPKSSFGVRSLVMPQIRYSSFEGRGEMLSQFCTMNTSFAESDDVHWSLVFTNSRFSGDFERTFVRALYRCPMIRSVSFKRNDDWQSIWGAEVEDEGQDNSGLLADMAGSLPRWVSSVTYDNTLDSGTLQRISKSLTNLERISTSQESANGRSAVSQSSLQSFAVRNSPDIGPVAWSTFFDLLGQQPSSRSLEPRALSSLRVLDLSGNDLGDALCSVVLTRILDKATRCCVERLDLSGNAIRDGENVGKALHKYKISTGIHATHGSQKAKLSYLDLSSNELNAGRLGLQVVSLLEHNALSLKSLDLSDNGLECHGYEFTGVLLGSLETNTTLRYLNLSENAFSRPCIDTLLHGINHDDNDCSIAFLRLENNRPPLTDSQQRVLDSFQSASRVALLRQQMDEDEQMAGGDIETTADGMAREAISNHTSALSTSKVDSLPAKDDDGTVSSRHQYENTITVLRSAPLVYRDEARNLRPFGRLNFEMERELLYQCFKESHRDIELLFDTATTPRLLAAKTRRTSCLIYSGHGHETHLPFENGLHEIGTGTHWLDVEMLRHLIVQEKGAPFQLVFVSACHSRLAGETFANAGVRHVVCCQQDSEVKDVAAHAFTYQFYLALASGRTVKESFQEGCNAVRGAPHLRDAVGEMNQFVLLPEGGDHDVPIFNARTVREWSQTTRFSDLEARNLIQRELACPPPSPFIGREIDMYNVLDLVLNKQLVSIVGENKVGRRSLAYAVCHYINERRSTMIPVIDGIFFVGIDTRKGDSGRFKHALRKLLQELKQDGRAPNDRCDDFESLIRAICKALGKKALLVIDGTDYDKGSDEQKDLVVFLSRLFQRQRAKVLLTGYASLGVPSIGGVTEHPYFLEPLNFGNTVELFSARSPHLCTRVERRRFCRRLEINGNDMERVESLFRTLGQGIPGKIVMAAQDLSRTEIDGLGLVNAGSEGPAFLRYRSI